MSQIMRDRIDADEWVTIDAAFVKRAVKEAFWQYFRPITATFETKIPVKPDSVATPDLNILKSPRVNLRGYVLRQK